MIWILGFYIIITFFGRAEARFETDAHCMNYCKCIGDRTQVSVELYYETWATYEKYCGKNCGCRPPAPIEEPEADVKECFDQLGFESCKEISENQNYGCANKPVINHLPREKCSATCNYCDCVGSEIHVIEPEALYPVGIHKWFKKCPAGKFVRAVSISYQPDKGSYDDLGITEISFHCGLPETPNSPLDSDVYTTIRTAYGAVGGYTWEAHYCHSTTMKGIRIKTSGFNNTDNVGITALTIYCDQHYNQYGYYREDEIRGGPDVGEYTDPVFCKEGYFVCGLIGRTSSDPWPYPDGTDYIGISGIRLLCCCDNS